MIRQEANRNILLKLSSYLDKNPDLRFNQALQILDIVKPTEDQYYEESEKTLSNMVDFIF